MNLKLYSLLWGPAEALLNFDYACAGLFIDFKNSSACKKHKKNFYSPKGRLLADSSRGPIVLLMYYFVLGNVCWTFNLQAVFCLFETLKMFSSPKGRLLADSSRGPIVFYL